MQRNRFRLLQKQRATNSLCYSTYCNLRAYVPSAIRTRLNGATRMEPKAHGVFACLIDPNIFPIPDLDICTALSALDTTVLASRSSNECPLVPAQYMDPNLESLSSRIVSMAVCNCSLRSTIDLCCAIEYPGFMKRVTIWDKLPA